MPTFDEEENPGEFANIPITETAHENNREPASNRNSDNMSHNPHPRTISGNYPTPLQTPSATSTAALPIPIENLTEQSSLDDIPVATCVSIDENNQHSNLMTEPPSAKSSSSFSKLFEIELESRKKREQEDADLAYAIQQQIQYEEEFRSSVQSHSSGHTHGTFAKVPTTNSTRVNNGSLPGLNDDEAYARTIDFLEQERASERAIRQHQLEEQRRRPSCFKRTINTLFLLAFTGVGAYVILYYATPYLKGRNPFDFFGKGIDWGDVWEEGDPTLWRLSNGNRRKGLQLTVLNACTDDWNTYFTKAINDWNKSPSLELETVKVEVDRACSGIRGKMKVCNDDYGETPWVGVNEVILENGFIVSSTARMNEYFMSKSTNAKKQYTMCHEIGHGLGLPHTDENFFNADLGNCLDYTNKPAVNQQPNQMNFDTLLDMYGTIPGKGSSGDLTTPKEIQTSTDSWDENGIKKWKHAEEGLSLVIINALTPEWFPYFDAVFNDWNQAPALDLIAVSTPADEKCEPVFQSMKVCNGNYGETLWVGINKIVLEDDKIIMSTAKMNDYWLKSETQEKKQYTMCHEIGHGFGLPHSDTIHTNKNMGNCLDYTDDPGENMMSGVYNWNRLEEMYGIYQEVKGNEKEKKKKKGKESDRKRFLRPWDNVNSKNVDVYPIIETNKWDMVHQSEFGEIHIAQLGAGLQVLAHIIYP